MSKPSAPGGHGSLATAGVTAAAIAVQTGLAAVVGVIIAREFGRTAETDGFFAAYGVFIVLALAANTVRLVVLPPLARARDERRLGGETVAWALALALFAVPLLVVAVVLDDPLGDILTGFGPVAARDVAAETLPLVVLAGVGQLYAGLAASALAALDDYLTAAMGFIVASALGLAVILLRVDADGIQAVGAGMAVNGLVAVAIPATALGVRARRASMTAASTRPTGSHLGGRVAQAGRGSALPLALQAAYLICLPLAAREGVGAVTSFGYAYLAGSAVVAATAASFGLVTSVPLTRIGLEASRVAHHVVATSWIALLAVGLTAGVFAVAGEPIVVRVLGQGYADTVGQDLGHLIATLSPWMVAAIGFTVTFPLVFVARRERALVWLALIVVVVQAIAAPVGQLLWGLTGLALALTATTVLALAGLLHQLAAARPTFAGLLRATAVVAAITVPSFVVADVLFSAAVAAVAGTVATCALVFVVRPAGFVDALRYLRALS